MVYFPKEIIVRLRIEAYLPVCHPKENIALSYLQLDLLISTFDKV
jgi:hypothetical protein